jgi:hypothetical protein
MSFDVSGIVISDLKIMNTQGINGGLFYDIETLFGFEISTLSRSVLANKRQLMARESLPSSKGASRVARGSYANHSICRQMALTKRLQAALYLGRSPVHKDRAAD